MKIKIRGQHFTLLPQKAIYWQEENTLLISDLHLGKVTHFRKEGIALPSVASEKNFTRLDELMTFMTPDKIIFLGDLFHSRYNEEWNSFAKWRMRHQRIEMKIVPGNHDVLPSRLFDEINISISPDEYRSQEFIFTHHPRENYHGEFHIFCGHVHPVFKLRTRGRQSIRFPCFVLDKRQTILPSFGVFTGGYEMEMQDGREVYGIIEESVIRINE